MDGVGVPADGEPYTVGVFPDSVVSLSTNASESVVRAGDRQVVTAQVLDDETPVPASINATIFAVDGTQQSITLVDDGTGGDAIAGDDI